MKASGSASPLTNICAQPLTAPARLTPDRAGGRSPTGRRARPGAGRRGRRGCTPRFQHRDRRHDAATDGTRAHAVTATRIAEADADVVLMLGTSRDCHDLIDKSAQPGRRRTSERHQATLSMPGPSRWIHRRPRQVNFVWRTQGGQRARPRTRPGPRPSAFCGSVDLGLRSESLGAVGDLRLSGARVTRTAGGPTVEAVEGCRARGPDTCASLRHSTRCWTFPGRRWPPFRSPRRG